MPDQVELLFARALPKDPPAARDRPTSVEASRYAKPLTSERRARILAELQRGPKTDEQLAEATGLAGNTVRPRRIELLRLNEIRDSGRTAKTRSGRDAIVWEAIP